MNISWSDVNNVQEAGDYPFRDGTITTTFAEVAIWKKNPSAHFQLMRKYPIVGAFRYLLGRQIGEKSLPAERLVEGRPPAATILIAYDIHFPKGRTYDDLVKAIQSLGTWWHHLESTWIVKCARTPGEIRDQLQSLIGPDDQLLVVDISQDHAEWAGINDTGSKWLKTI
jgi:hypothetical protein